MPGTNTFARAANLGTSTGQGQSNTNEFQFADSDSVRLRLRIPPNWVGNGKPFLVQAGGRATGGGTTNLTINLDHGDSATIGSNTTIETSGAIAINSVSGNWHIQAKLFVDATSDRLQGKGWGEVNGIIVAEAATAIVASVDPELEIAFTVTGTFSASAATTLAICDYFEAVML